MSSIQRILALIVKEFQSILRDPKSRFVVIGPPFVQFLIFGYAATFDVKEVDYATLDQSHSVSSRALLSRFAASESFSHVTSLQSTEEIAEVIDSQKVRLVIQIEPEFEDRLARGEAAPIQVIADGRNANVASVATGYINTIVGQFNAAEGYGTPALAVVDRAWFNSNLQSRWYVITPLGAEIAMVIVMLLASLSVAREREFGTFDQLLVAPFRPIEILVGKATPGIVFGVLNGLLLAAGGVWWFEIPFRGTILALVAILLVFTIAIVGFGLFVSSLSSSMQQGLLGAFVFIMPATILSGFTTPIENMPDWLQVGTYLNPLRYAVAGLRKVFLEGAGITDVIVFLWPMALISLVTLSSASWFFRHRSA